MSTAARLSVDAAADDLPDDIRRSLQAAWERAEMARAELANDHPLLNA